jgi:uncharacterized membrane protein YdjX (TVP38/TMEM64 family)
LNSFKSVLRHCKFLSPGLCYKQAGRNDHGNLYSAVSPFWAMMLAGPAVLALLHALHTLRKTQLEIPTVFSAWCASIIVLVLVWRMRVPVLPDLHLHLSGVALFCLMFGRSLAITGISIAIALYTLNMTAAG